MAEPLAALLRRSLAHLADEVPASHDRVVAELGSLLVEVVADGEAFTVRADGPRIVVADGPAAAPGIRIGTGRATILDIIDARTGLAEAVESGRLDVRGTVEDVLRAHDVLLAYAHAAVRAPSAPGLLTSLRSGVPR